MSIEQYQRTITTLNKEIAELEKKKASVDKRAADEAKKASSIIIRKTDSTSTINSKINQIDRHNNAKNKALEEGAEYSKRIADKRVKLNDAYRKLQNEEQKERNAQKKTIDNIRKKYEDRIAELESSSLRPPFFTISNSSFIPSHFYMTSKRSGSDSSEQYDVFISHASEDKETFVDGLVKEMENAGLTVWYDTSQLRWGDSMRQRIDDGLRKSKFGVIVLSPNYIADDKYWTKAELNGLFQLESINGKVILPIWYNLNKQDIINFSPLIADKKALKSSDFTAKEMAEELASLLNKNKEEFNNGQDENGIHESHGEEH